MENNILPLHTRQADPFPFSQGLPQKRPQVRFAGQGKKGGQKANPSPKRGRGNGSADLPAFPRAFRPAQAGKGFFHFAPKALFPPRGSLAPHHTTASIAQKTLPRQIAAGRESKKVPATSLKLGIAGFRSGIQSFNNFVMNFKKSPKIGRIGNSTDFYLKIFYSAAIPLVLMAPHKGAGGGGKQKRAVSRSAAL
jgi:hypothetical protein